MKIFIKILKWLFLVMSMTVPVSVCLTASIGGPVATILSAVWGLPCGFIATKFFIGEDKCQQSGIEVIVK